MTPDRRAEDERTALSKEAIKSAFLDDLFTEIGDAYLSGLPGVERGFNGRSNFVGVDMTVIESVATDDHDQR